MADAANRREFVPEWKHQTRRTRIARLWSRGDPDEVSRRATRRKLRSTKREKLGYHPNSFVIIRGLSTFSNVSVLDVSFNSLSALPEDIGQLTNLTSLIARNNLLEHLPKSMQFLERIENLYLSGNHFEYFPPVIMALRRLKTLHIGGNHISELPYTISTLESLTVLYLGGNRLREIPASIGCLYQLENLGLCDNVLETIPSTLGDLHYLETLSLHNNRLRTLPTDILNLRRLQQLSLRNNPLVHSFVHNMDLAPPSLKELSGRIVRQHIDTIPNFEEILPTDLAAYLNSACQCVNPECKGVYFDARVEHVKFVDFCGKYRVPLMQFLCSPRCSAGVPTVAYETSSESEEEIEPIMRRVLLG
uniref:Leucine-rich repeat-containing protein 58 n=1 Tax=Caenorhabditis japonica TaxID=281687 RepID=A0A8R1HHC1_CAEJA